MSEKIGIEETLDVVNFLESTLKDAAAAKGGGLSSSEVIKIGVMNAPGGIKAAVGAGKIPAELLDLDKEELLVLLPHLQAMMESCLALFAASSK